ncbi:MAG: CDP-alcohol phosphatidyltransferase family protein [Amaricoccus sp.]
MTEAASPAQVIAARRSALPPILFLGAAVAAVLVALPFSSTATAPAGLLAYGAVAAVVFDRLPLHHPHPRFGLGNVITLLRAAGTAVLAGLALEPGVVAGSRGWWALGGVAVLLSLDGVDGWAARRKGHASAFGARFDMEVDALLLLALSALALGLAKAGVWILAIGLMRYAFVLAGQVWPPLARPLLPSRRRDAVCVLQVATLGLLLAPPVTHPLSTALAAAALAALAASFATDVAWLLRRA